MVLRPSRRARVSAPPGPSMVSSEVAPDADVAQGALQGVALGQVKVAAAEFPPAGPSGARRGRGPAPAPVPGGCAGPRPPAGRSAPPSGAASVAGRRPGWRRRRGNRSWGRRECRSWWVIIGGWVGRGCPRPALPREEGQRVALALGRGGLGKRGLALAVPDRAAMIARKSWAVASSQGRGDALGQAFLLAVDAGGVAPRFCAARRGGRRSFAASARCRRWARGPGWRRRGRRRVQGGAFEGRGPPAGALVFAFDLQQFGQGAFRGGGAAVGGDAAHDGGVGVGVDARRGGRCRSVGALF